VLVEIVDDDFRQRLAFELDDDARVLVRLVADRRDVRDDLGIDQLRDAFDEHRPVDVVRDFRDDDLFAPVLEFLAGHPAPHPDAAAAGLGVLLGARETADGAASGKIRAFDMRHQALDRDVRVVDLRADGVDDLTEIMRRNIGRHADGDAGAAVDKQVGESGREDGRLGPRLVVIGDEIDGVLLHVVHQRGAEMGEPRLRVPHGSGRIALDRAEISLAVDEPFAHRPGLRHVDEGRVNDRFAVRVIIARRIAADLGAFPVLPARKERQIVHGEQNAPLGRFQAIAGVGQRARDDDRHRVVQKRFGHFLGDIDALDFIVGIRHAAGREKGAMAWEGYHSPRRKSEQ
jgi:hypothetical protein